MAIGSLDPDDGWIASRSPMLIATIGNLADARCPRRQPGGPVGASWSELAYGAVEIVFLLDQLSARTEIKIKRLRWSSSYETA